MFIDLTLVFGKWIVEYKGQMLVRTQVTAMEACKVAIMIQSGDCHMETCEVTTLLFG